MILLESYSCKQYYNDGCVEFTDFIQLDNGNRICINDINPYNNIDCIVVDCYVHPESDAYWIICKHKDGQYFEIDVPNGIGYGEFKDTSKLSGGSQW